MGGVQLSQGLLFNSQSPGVPGTHLINPRTIKD